MDGTFLAEKGNDYVKMVTLETKNGVVSSRAIVHHELPAESFTEGRAAPLRLSNEGGSSTRSVVRAGLRIPGGTFTNRDVLLRTEIFFVVESTDRIQYVIETRKLEKNGQSAILSQLSGQMKKASSAQVLTFLEKQSSDTEWSSEMDERYCSQYFLNSCEKLKATGFFVEPQAPEIVAEVPELVEPQEAPLPEAVEQTEAPAAVAPLESVEVLPPFMPFPDTGLQAASVNREIARVLYAQSTYDELIQTFGNADLKQQAADLKPFINSYRDSTVEEMRTVADSGLLSYNLKIPNCIGPLSKESLDSYRSDNRNNPFSEITFRPVTFRYPVGILNVDQNGESLDVPLTTVFEITLTGFTGYMHSGFNPISANVAVSEIDDPALGEKSLKDFPFHQQIVDIVSALELCSPTGVTQ